MKAKWIWYPGDYEIYHSLLLHARRREGGFPYPVVWQQKAPQPTVAFYKEVTCTAPLTFRVFVKNCDCGRLLVDYYPFDIAKEITLAPGTHKLELQLMASAGFPTAYINAEGLVTDESWMASDRTAKRLPVGCEPAYTKPSDNPNVFPFVYRKEEPISVEEKEGGLLYDYGRETFLRLVVSALSADEILLSFGESKEEALDTDFAVNRFTLTGKKKYRVPATALRYLFVKAKVQPKIKAEYEYLPLTDVGSFACDNETVNNVWQVCARTFHLNSREFFLDGIKRDRWVWSGDAYQSFFVNRYLYFDNAITKRTLVALLGKPPYTQHINTINDYSMYLILSFYDYYLQSGDLDFIKLYFDRILQLYEFINGRTDENGYVVERTGDWIFIDWGTVEKNGAVAAEQILLWQTKKVMAELSKLLQLPFERYLEEAKQLQKSVMVDFFRPEKNGFVDCIGSSHITRQANIFAVLYDFVSPALQKRILANVLENSSIDAITTPYFKFFELMVLCKWGKTAEFRELLRSYWGGMIALGATCIWEQFDPKKEGTAHLEMYGNKYGCSLCHAWGAGPIYLLGRYVLGVRSAGVAYCNFEVAPNPEGFGCIKGSVPLPNGKKVTVSADEKTVTVFANAEGGTLVWKGKSYPIPCGKKITVGK